MRNDLYVAMKRGGIDRESLKEIQRIILTTDGTVTDILEAYCREAMVVNVLRQDRVRIDGLEPSRRALLGFASDPVGEALKREILLRGEISGSCHLYADSSIVIDRLPAAIRNGLLDKNKAIGHLLLEHRVHTFKEIVECYRQPAGPLAKAFEIREDAPLLSRTYVVSVDRLPIMLITEKIPEFGR